MPVPVTFDGAVATTRSLVALEEAGALKPLFWLAFGIVALATNVVDAVVTGMEATLLVPLARMPVVFVHVELEVVMLKLRCFQPVGGAVPVVPMELKFSE